MFHVPEGATVLIIGGGPAGSYSATLLACEGLNVVLLEAVKHPREHIGESMLPSMRHYLRFIDLESEYSSRGFMHKPGASFKFDHDEREYYTDFNVLGPDMTTWNVVRAEADELMLRHAEKQGVKVFEKTRVESIAFDNNNGDAAEARPVSATWKRKSGEAGEIKFDWLIDASGRQGIMSTKYLKNRIYREGLRNVAAYGYWMGVKVFDEGGPRSNAPWFESLTDKLGWAWCIPLHNGTHSIGVVMHLETSNKKKAEGPSKLEDHYMSQLQLAPGVMDMIGDSGKFVQGSARSTSDFSYHASSYSGDHYRIVGDAAAFVDPLFSNGVHVALTGALSAASTIPGSMKGQVTEIEGQSWHDAKIGICQTRFLLVVLSSYRQMQHQGENKVVITDVDSTSFAQAFAMFRPIYQGEDDTSGELTNAELEKMISFTRNRFTPMTNQQYQSVNQRLGDLLNLDGPVIGPEELDKVLDTDDSDAKAVLKRINALKILRNDGSPESFASESVNGYVVRLDRGHLGLVKV